MRIESLDHIALWVANRDSIADEAVRGLGMHVIDRTDRFTLIGSDARRGKLTLFDAEGPRERGALKHVGLRVNDLDAATELLGGDSAELPDGLHVRLVEAPTEVEYDLDHVALFSRDPEGAAAEYLELGFAPASPGAGRLAPSRGRRRVRRVPPGGSGRLGPAAAESRRRARSFRGRPARRGAPPGARGRRRRGRREHEGRVRLGPRRRQDRVRGAQGDLLACLVEPLSSRAPEWPASPRRCAPGSWAPTWSSTRRQPSPAARCSSRAGSSGATASGSSCGPSARAAIRRFSGSSGNGWTTRLPGSSRRARPF